MFQNHFLQDPTRLHLDLPNPFPGEIQHAANFIQAIQDRQGLKVACLEEIAYRKGYIDREQLQRIAQPMSKNSYGQYLLELAEEDEAQPA